jgi:hypothetical protein
MLYGQDKNKQCLLAIKSLKFLLLKRGRLMETIEIKLDEQTLARALQLAKSYHCTLDELLKEIIENIESLKSKKSTIMGMFSDEPELIDQIVESVMTAREKHSLR